MFEQINRMFLAGVGAAAMTRHKAEEIFEEAVSQGQAARGQREEFVTDLMDRAASARKELEQLVQEQVSEAMGKLNLPTKADLERIETKLDELPAIKARLSEIASKLESASGGGKKKSGSK